MSLPAHAVIGTRTGAMTEHERCAGWRKFASRAKSGARMGALSAKVTLEQVAEIRASSETCAVISKKYGICANHVGVIRRYEAWRGPIAATNNSVFAWRGAA